MKVKADTVARTVILALALVNQILSASGKPVINIGDETINALVSTGFTVIAAILAWWKNNSFTNAAIQADQVKKELKENTK